MILISRRSLLKASLAAPLIIPRRSAKAVTTNKGAWAIGTGAGALLTAPNVTNMPTGVTAVLGSYWYWHTTAPTSVAAQAIFRAGAQLQGTGAGRMFSIDHTVQTNGVSSLQIGISGPPPSFIQNWWYNNAVGIPTGNIGYSNLTFSVDFTNANQAVFLLNGAPLAVTSSPGYPPTQMYCDFGSNPVRHLATGLGGKGGRTPQYPFLGYFGEFYLYDISAQWVDPNTVIGGFYDPTNETPPDFRYLYGNGSGAIANIKPFFYCSGPPQSYVYVNKAGDNTGGRFTPDPNSTLTMAGRSLVDPAGGDMWGNMGS